MNTRTRIEMPVWCITAFLTVKIRRLSLSINYVNSEFSISVRSKIRICKAKVIFRCVFNHVIAVFILLSLSSDIVFLHSERNVKRRRVSLCAYEEDIKQIIK